MNHVSRKLAVCGAIAALCAVEAFADDSSAWVADPYRATAAKWKKHIIKGRDFWHFLETDYLSVNGVKDLPMVRDSATQWVRTDCTPAIAGFTRRICVKDVKAKDEKGAAVPVEMELTSDEPGTTVDKGDGFTVLSAPFCDLKVRYLPARGRITLRAARPFKSVTIGHGSPRGAVIDDVVATSSPAKIGISRTTCRLDFAKPVSEAWLDIASVKPGFLMRGVRDEAKFRERLENAPFTVLPPSIFWGSIGAPKGFFENREALKYLAERYPETFLGVEITEWDANFLQKVTHGVSGYHLRDLMKVREIPTDRNGMVRNMALQWDNYVNLYGDRLSSMSGGLNFQLYAGDFGAKVACTELSGERVSKAQRLAIMYTMSAARQFDIPASIYIAYYCGAENPDSRRALKNANFFGGGIDFGQAPSLTSRNFYPFYYLGGNFISFESQPYGQVEPVDPDGTSWKLSGNGRAIEDLYNWYRGEAGARGDGYAPILFLEDRRAGDDQAWPLAYRKASFYGLFESTDGDLMTEYMMRAVSSPNGHESPTDPAGGSSHFNSSLGNIFNMALANPLRSGEVSAEHLAKYAVVIVAGDLVWSESLANRVKRYVADGGTLVITPGQSHPFDSDFLGAVADVGATVAEDGLVVCKAKLRKDTKVLKATSSGMPLITASRYGAGQVDYVLSPFFKKALAKGDKPDSRFVAPPQVKEFLETLQDAVLPVKVKGDCEFTLNRVDDGSWRVCLVNNLGSVKDPKGTEEKLLPEWARDVTLTLPAGATAKEVRLGAKPKVSGNEWTYTVPPAGILVVKVDGVSAVAKGVQAEVGRKAYSPVSGFTRRFETTGVPNDGFRYDPANRQLKGTAPELVGEWLAKNGFKDTSGNKHNLKLTGKFDEVDGVAYAEKGNKAYASASYPVDYPLYQGTFETWVKPASDLSAFAADKAGRGRQGGILFVNGGAMFIYYCEGKWACTTMGGRRLDITGPEAKPEWTHLAITFDHELIRFYVNGKEAVSPEGPLRSLSGQGINGFFSRMSFIYGSADPGWNNYFRGGMKGLRCYSRCFTPEEIAAKAKETW